LVVGTLAFVESSGRLIEASLGRVTVPSQLALAIKCFLRKYHFRLRALHRSLARRDDLGTCAGGDICKLSLGNCLGGKCLLKLGECLRVVDPHQHGAGDDILATLHRDFADASVDPCRDVEARGVHLALHQQRFGAHQVPDRQSANGDGHDGDDDGWHTARRRRTAVRPVLCLRLYLFQHLRRFRGGGLRGRVKRRRVHLLLRAEASWVAAHLARVTRLPFPSFSVLHFGVLSPAS
jgi:hypothetical protein